MKYFYKFLTIIFTAYLLSSCLGKRDDYYLFSENPDFVSLEFAQNDSIPHLETAIFTLEFDVDLNDSVIVNLDSLPHKTRIDSVYPIFTFRSTSAAYLLQIDSLGAGFDTIPLTGKDTIDFTRVKSVTNYPALHTAEPRTYPIKVNVHQIEPELYVWKEKLHSLYTHPGDVQKVVYHNDKFLFLVSSGFNNYLYMSDDAESWSDPLAISSLPAYLNFRDLCVFDDKLMMVHEDAKIYESQNGLDWTAKDPSVEGYSIVNLLFVLEGNLWAIFKQKISGKYFFAETKDADNWQIKEEIDKNFPIADFAALSFSSRTNNPKAVVLGGFSPKGELLNTVWSVQKNVDNAYKWVNLTQGNTSFKPISGASLIAYDNKLLMFGGVDIEGELIADGFRESIDEGLNWRQTDTIHAVIKDREKELLYQPRAYQSVIYDPEDHYIYLFGGRTQNENGISVFTDVWKGKLNRMFFLRK